MKAEFENIGPVKQRTGLELGDLTIIAGQNNTGKTYLVYTLYDFLQFLHSKGERIFSLATDSHIQEIYHDITTKLKKTGEVSISLEDYHQREESLLRKASSFFSTERLHQVFSAPREAFEDASFILKAPAHHIKCTTIGKNSRAVIYEIRIRQEGDKVIFSLDLKDGQVSENIDWDSSDILDAIVWLVVDEILGSDPEPFLICAERIGISLFYKELDFNRNRLVEVFHRSEGNFSELLDARSARYAKPIRDNIDFIRDLSEVQKQKSELVTDKVRRVDNMMDGYYEAKPDEIRFVSRRRKEHRFDIPLHLASSSARGVCDLYFYLKHKARLGQLLIIDEPESHLSPSNQVLMARLLAFCVNAGLKVLITTQSDYLIKEINNLIMLHGDFEGKADFLKKYKKEYTAEDHLSPGSVKAYACEDGTLTPCEVDRMGIDMPVFDDEIDKINEISMTLALKKTTDGQRDD